jgi:hypothetical protein
MRDMKTVEQIRQGRQQASQNQDMVNAAPGTAAMIKAVSQAKKTG